jgi:hypothetical protein
MKKYGKRIYISETIASATTNLTRHSHSVSGIDTERQSHEYVSISQCVNKCCFELYVHLHILGSNKLGIRSMDIIGHAILTTLVNDFGRQRVNAIVFCTNVYPVLSTRLQGYLK